MKIKIETDSNGRLIQWGHANDTREVGEKVGSFVVIDQQDMSQVISDHAALIDGQIVLDEGYTEPKPPQQEAEPSVADLQAKVDTQNEAITQLTNLVVAVADPDKLNKALGL